MRERYVRVILFLALVWINMQMHIVQTYGGQKVYEGICIDEEVFGKDATRLNTEIYQVAVEYCSKAKMDKYFGKNTTPLVESVKQHIDPLIAVAITTAETPNYADRSITWTSAIYSKPLVSKGFGSWDKLHVQDVDSDFYLYNGLSSYFTCGSNCRRKDGALHMQCLGSARNDNDSLGPAQILRRYLYQASGCITAYNADNTIYGITVDLMRWEDNVVWVLNNSLSKFRGITSGKYRAKYEIRNEYELLVLMAIAHNTGASFIQVAGSAYISPYWEDADGIWLYAKLLTTEGNIAYLKEKYIEPWYENIVLPSIREGRSFELPGNVFSDGDINQVRSSALLRELGFGLIRISYVKSDDSEPCSGWGSVDGCFNVLEHKQRYPLKSLVNYLALEKLYHSGEGK